MGGTFDPIHYGHLLAAEEARERFGLDRVLFIPSGTPPHKKDYPVSPAEHRYVMTVLATADNPHFFVSRTEMDRPGPSYAVDTVRLIAAEHPGAVIVFITGADAVLEILQWKDAANLIAQCEFIAVTRPGYDLAALDRLDPDFRARVQRLVIPGIEVSSTDLRERVRNGMTLAYLTPRPVERYIAKYGLYQGAEPAPEAAAWTRTAERWPARRS